jgi:ABC-type cobalamin transport system permease subunit
VRDALALLAGGITAALGALILGEYPFSGATPYVAGLLYALVVSEVVLSIGRRHSLAGGVALGLVCGAGMGWAVWISTGRGVTPVPAGGWVAVAIAVVVGGGRGLRWAAGAGRSPG